jgi:hypothetical protein
MTIGFDQPLYILLFDHLGSFQTKMFGWIGRRFRNWVEIFENARGGCCCHETAESHRWGTKLNGLNKLFW